MSQVLIQKSIENDIGAKKLCVQTLMVTLNESILNNKYIEMEREGDVLVFIFSSSLTIEESLAFDSIVQNHQPSSPIITILQDAETFGRHLLDEYKQTNILRGRTTTQVDQMLTDLDGVMVALTTGSLYVALSRVTAMTTTDTVTQEDKDNFILKLQKYLNL